MKSLFKFFLFASAVSLSLSSCSNSSDEDIAQDEEKIFVSLDISSNIQSATRADLSGLDKDSDAGFIWANNDLIAVSADGKTCFHSITVNATGTSNTAKASGSIDRTNSGYRFIYPASAAKSTDGDKEITFEIPSTQTVKTGFCIDPNAIIQVCHGTIIKNQTIEFSTPCALMAFSVGGSDIKQVQITAYKQEGESLLPFGIVGEMTVTVTNSGSLASGTGSTNNNTVICKYENDLCFPKNHTYAVAIRPGRPYKLEVVITKSDNSTITKVASGDNIPQFTVGHYYKFASFE